eukprot:CAMPEP_0171695646 /NCGR_PEP_ID=MMETSP0991-20121206/7876_1 /TAXON_ID=483369 /ORGANISM="non described non described, Strain CCMP2098" /LENGTH=416 /DNA_ID=CAMNT_0012284341 /DNA_START=412 /DNA_END=1659 /DNA_ORIENTATION=-
MTQDVSLLSLLVAVLPPAKLEVLTDDVGNKGNVSSLERPRVTAVAGAWADNDDNAPALLAAFVLVAINGTGKSPPRSLTLEIRASGNGLMLFGLCFSHTLTRNVIRTSSSSSLWSRSSSPLPLLWWFPSEGFSSLRVEPGATVEAPLVEVEAGGCKAAAAEFFRGGVEEATVKAQVAPRGREAERAPLNGPAEGHRPVELRAALQDQGGRLTRGKGSRAVLANSGTTAATATTAPAAYANTIILPRTAATATHSPLPRFMFAAGEVRDGRELGIEKQTVGLKEALVFVPMETDVPLFRVGVAWPLHLHPPLRARGRPKLLLGHMFGVMLKDAQRKGFEGAPWRGPAFQPKIIVNKTTAGKNSIVFEIPKKIPTFGTDVSTILVDRSRLSVVPTIRPSSSSSKLWGLDSWRDLESKV